MSKISLLYPEKDGVKVVYNTLSEETVHNLGFDQVVTALSPIEAERTFIMRILSHMTDDPYVAEYRAEVFEDILNFPELREKMMKILDRMDFLKSYGTFKRDYEESASAFELIHRLEEINDYIICVEAVRDCLSGAGVSSRGLKDLKQYVENIYNNNAFEELKEDISRLKASTTDFKSVTLGVNLNARFEAESIGVISLNNKPFTKSGVISSFSDALSMRKDRVQDGNEWDGGFKYQPFNPTASEIAASIERMGKLKIASTSAIGFLTMATIPAGDATSDVTRYMDRVVNHMLFLTVRKLRTVLNKYVNITITDITDLIPEFMYYIRWAEYVEKLKDVGYVFKRARVKRPELPKDSEQAVSETDDTTPSADREADAEKTSPCDLAVGVYNLLLAQSHLQEKMDIVRNDLSFDREHCIYILTGANRGGKTTITVAVGQLFVMAQGGIFIPGSAFEYTPVDCIFTHFPADEDKTMDLGRLGEECKRFKELYEAATGRSLILLNETFSTTSFEEGYYIARDSVRALLKKGVRTIYNTHMHKLARDIDEINASVEGVEGMGPDQISDSPAERSGGNVVPAKAKSLIVRSDGENRSFKIAVAPPEGMSYAEDIARKYGVTYEMLTEEKPAEQE